MYILLVNNGKNPFPSVTVVVVCSIPIWNLNSGKCGQFLFAVYEVYIVCEVYMKPYHQTNAIQVVLKHFEGLGGDRVAYVGIMFSANDG